MGKSLPSATKLQEFAKFVSPGRFQTPKRAKTISQIRVSAPESGKPGAVRLESERVKQQKLMESSEGQQSESRMPLGQVVSDCVKRWFQDALKEAKAGDSGMQVLVGQMYYSGYGVPRDPQKVNLFFPSFLFLVFSF
jgi:TPR repeat protein